MRNKWLLYLVLFLLAVNAAIMSVYLVDNRTEMRDVRCEKRDSRNKDKSSYRFEHHLAEALNFTEQQQSDVHNYREGFLSKRKAIKIEINELRQAYFQALAKESYDTVQLSNIAEQIGLLEAEKLKVEFEHYRNIRSVCTAEQAVAMDSLGRVHMNKKFKGKGSEHERRRDCTDTEKSNK